MSENKILQFAGDPSALTQDDVTYADDYERLVGNQPGIARPEFVNKALKQSSFMSAVLAQFIVDNAEEDVQDDQSVALAVANFIIALQLTTGFAEGTRLSFPQAVPPLTWTQDATYNDMALRVVNGEGGGIGGTHGLSTPPSTAHIHTTANHTLTIPEMPAHSHGNGAHYSVYPYGGAEYPVTEPYPMDVVGGNQPHNHGNTGSATSTSFAPKYVDVIICTKD
jgi:hypothetical protein